MKLFQNKFFIICLCVALVLSVVPSTFALMGYVGLAENILGTVTLPVRWVFTTAADGVEGIFTYFTSIDALNEKIDALEEENKALSDRLAEAELTELENDRLRDYLGLKNQYPSFTMEEAMVVSYTGGNYMTTLNLNRGSLHGIESGMAVITADGIVGQVIEVGLNWCKVSTIIETKGGVGAYVPRSEETGIVIGDPSMRNEGLCKIAYTKADPDIEIGDTVLSVGANSVYPADLKIGTVTAVTVNEYSQTTTVTVKPAADLENLKRVMIVTGFEEN